MLNEHWYVEKFTTNCWQEVSEPFSNTIIKFFLLRIRVGKKYVLNMF